MTQSAQSAPPAVLERKVKLKEITDQFSEDEAPVLSDFELARCHAVFEATYGKDEKPAEEEVLALEQLSALQ